MSWEADASGRRGRQQTDSDAAIQACLTRTVLFGLPLRQTTGFVESLLKRVGLEWSVPDLSTLCRRQKTLSVAIPYKRPAGRLYLLVDSTGIKAEGEWNARKHGGPKRCLWRNIHIGVDEETLEIRAIEVTSSSMGAARCCQTCSARSHLIKSLAASRRTEHMIHANAMMRLRHAMRTPSYPPKMWKPDTAGAKARNEAVRSSKHLGRALWRNLTGYHRRSRVETKCIV